MLTNNIQDTCLPQSKSYLKILDILYLSEGTNMPIDLGVVESIIKSTYIFDNIKITSKPWVVKVSPKLNMAIVWIDIWDAQSGSLAKTLINRCFNVSSYITTIRGMNMNPGVLQCKNYWKWGHTTFTCRFQGSRYIKCNGLHKVEYYCHFTWCCKANFKMNSPCLKTKQSELCSYTFKCINCKGDHQADSNVCLFWCHHFNKE